VSVAPGRRSRLWSVVAGLALAALEVGWFVWFYREPLPNASNAGAAVPRWIFPARALPEVVPGVSFGQSYLGLAVRELSHVENLPQRLPVVLAAGWIGLAAVGLGGLAMRSLRLDGWATRAERLALCYGLGASALGVLTLGVGRLGWLAPWPARVGLGLGVVAAGVDLARGRREGALRVAVAGPGWLTRAGFWAAAGPFLVLMALGAMLPTIDFDAIEYHLQGPKEYYQAGRVAFLPHNVYTSMPSGVEMLHLLGMEALDDWWLGALAGQLLIAAFAPAAAVLVAGAAGRAGSPRAGLVAAGVYLTTPWVYRLGVLPYVEGPLCYYHAALLWAAARAWSEADPRARLRVWGLAGLLAGGAFACKYPALISAVAPLGLVCAADALRRRSPALILAYILGWAAVATPWLARDLDDTGNPVYPLAFDVFGGRHWDAALDAKWAAAHGRKPVSAALFAASALDVAGRSDWQSPLYLALAPLAFARRGSRRFAAAAAGFALSVLLAWWLLTHRLDRFWLPALPALAVLAGLGADWSRRAAWSVGLGLMLGLAVLGNLAYSTTALTGLNEWTGDLPTLRRTVPAMLNPPLARLDEALPAGAKPLLVGQAAVFHLRHSVVYNTVFNHETFETVARDRPPAAVLAELRRRGVTHVYVDWHEVERYRSPGNYGFTPFVRPAEFDRLVRASVLGPPEAMGPRQDLYRVLGGGPASPAPESVYSPNR